LVLNSGEREWARTLLEANLHMLSNVPTTERTRTIIHRREKTREQLDLTRPCSPEFDVLRRLERRKQRVLARFYAPEADALPTEAWAQQVVDVLGWSANSNAIDAADESKLGYSVIQKLHQLASSQRRDTKIDAARRTADRVLGSHGRNPGDFEVPDPQRTVQPSNLRRA
jgi:hypothetical protein